MGAQMRKRVLDLLCHYLLSTQVISAVILFGLILFPTSNANAQTCGQVYSVSVSPQSYVNDTNVAFFQPPDGSPGFYAYGMITATAQSCAGDPESGLDIRVKDTSGNTDMVACD